MEENKKTLAEYNEHVLSIHKLVKETYGVECHAMANAITTKLISPSLLMRHLLTGEVVPDPEYIMFSVAKDLNQCQIKEDTFGDYVSSLADPDRIHGILDEAMELTDSAGFGDVEA
jgi:hypothetical protein